MFTRTSNSPKAPAAFPRTLLQSRLDTGQVCGFLVSALDAPSWDSLSCEMSKDLYGLGVTEYDETAMP